MSTWDFEFQTLTFYAHAHFQKFETFIRVLEGGNTRSSRCSSARDTCGGSGSVSTRTRSSSARRSTATAPVAFPASWRAPSSAVTSRMPSCTMAPSCASCPNGPWSCNTRQSVRWFARCRNASGLCRAASSASARLQNTYRGSCSSSPSSVSVVLLASKAGWQLAQVNRNESLAAPRGTRCHAGHTRLVAVGSARPRRVRPRCLW